MKLVGERRAIAALILAFYTILFLMNALMGPPEMAKAIGAIALCYGVAFFALVAGYFWARWFAMGTALFGVILGAVGVWQMGPEETILFLGGTHLAAVLALWGDSMAVSYDGQSAWRERFHIDENARHRLGKAIMRAGATLPMFILYGLAPRPGSLDTFGLMHAHSIHGVNLAGIGGAAVVTGLLAIAPLVIGRARAR
jgi:hypothetical protein